MSVVASDNFNRANADPIGGSWVTGSGEGAFKIVSNAATNSGAGDCSAYYNTTFPNDQYSQAKFSGSTTSADSGAGQGLVTRQSASARTHYRVVFNNRGPDEAELAKFVAGTYTQLWSRTITYSTGTVGRIESQGTTQRVFYNGAQVGADATDSAISSGFAGVAYSSTDSGTTIDDWEGGDFTVAALPKPVIIRQAVQRAAVI